MDSRLQPPAFVPKQAYRLGVRLPGGRGSIIPRLILETCERYKSNPQGHLHEVVPASRTQGQRPSLVPPQTSPDDRVARAAPTSGRHLRSRRRRLPCPHGHHPVRLRRGQRARRQLGHPGESGCPQAIRFRLDFEASLVGIRRRDRLPCLRPPASIAPSEITPRGGELHRASGDRRCLPGGGDDFPTKRTSSPPIATSSLYYRQHARFQRPGRHRDSVPDGVLISPGPAVLPLLRNEGSFALSTPQPNPLPSLADGSTTLTVVGSGSGVNTGYVTAIDPAFFLTIPGQVQFEDHEPYALQCDRSREPVRRPAPQHDGDRDPRRARPRPSSPTWARSTARPSRTSSSSRSPPASISQALPAITLTPKLTNGTDNNTAPGASLPVGSTATFTYSASNTGNVPWAGPHRGARRQRHAEGDTTDDFDATPVDAAGTAFNIGDTNNDGLLDPTETWTFTAAMHRHPGPVHQRRNRHRHRPDGDPPGHRHRPPRTSSVPPPAITLTKLTNGTDNNTKRSTHSCPSAALRPSPTRRATPGNVPLSGRRRARRQRHAGQPRRRLRRDAGRRRGHRVQRRRHERQRPARPDRDLDLHRDAHRHPGPVHQRRHHHRHPAGRPPEHLRHRHREPLRRQPRHHPGEADQRHGQQHGTRALPARRQHGHVHLHGEQHGQRPALRRRRRRRQRHAGRDLKPTTLDATPCRRRATAFNVGDTNDNGLLDPTETWTFTCDAAAPLTPGQYTNVGTATATFCAGRPPRTSPLLTATEENLASAASVPPYHH